MQIRSRLINAIVLALLMADAQASQSLDLVLDLAKSKAYRTREVDWKAVEAQARALEKSQGEDAAIRMVISALGDRHTSYRPAYTSAAGSTTPTKPAAPSIVEVLPPNRSVPTLRINRWSGSDQKGATSAVSSSLEKVLRSKPCGLILDFSENSGGNMWPMLIGLKPLLSDGELGGFRRPDGTIDRITKEDGSIKLGGKPHFLNNTLSATTQEPPKFIAIVVSERSASSGEITPLMFFGQKNVKFFGQKSSGFTSANQVFPLPNGGTLVLTTSMTEDRNGRPHPAGIEPDSITGKPLEDSARWLEQKCHV